MKRSNSDRGSGSGGGPGSTTGGAKRHRNNDSYAEALAEGKFELRFLIPTKCAGAVIGRGGEKIKSIREKYNAVLTVPDKSTPERVFTMIVAFESLAECFQEVLSNLSDELKNKRDELEIRILIHQSMAGAIIGRGGEKIKELREQTGSSLKVFPECAPMSTDRVLLIASPQEKIPEIIKQMVEFMKEIPIKGITKQYDASNYDPRAAASYGGFPGNGASFTGPPRQRGPAIDPFDGGRGAYDTLRQQPGYTNPTAYGGTAAVGGGYGDYNRQQFGSNSNAYPIGGTGAGPTYGGTRPGPPPQMGAAGYEITTTQVTIPDELAGTIIGKGGERINRIRQESGARIDVGSTTYGSNERIITITGTPHQIQSAQYHLQQSVKSSDAGRRYLSQQQR